MPAATSAAPLPPDLARVGPGSRALDVATGEARVEITGALCEAAMTLAREAYRRARALLSANRGDGRLVLLAGEAGIGPERTRMWLLYLAGCSLAFERAAVGVNQTLASKRRRTR